MIDYCKTENNTSTSNISAIDLTIQHPFKPALKNRKRKSEIQTTCSQNMFKLNNKRIIINIDVFCMLFLYVANALRHTCVRGPDVCANSRIYLSSARRYCQNVPFDNVTNVSTPGATNQSAGYICVEAFPADLS